MMSKLFSTLMLLVAASPALAFSEPSVVPEPGSLALVGIAVAAAVFVLSRKKK